MKRHAAIAVAFVFIGWAAWSTLRAADPTIARTDDASFVERVVDRSPVDLVLTPDDRWLLTANQTADSVSLVCIADGQVVAEVGCGRRPTALALSPDGRRVLVSATISGEVTVLALSEGALSRVGTIAVGFEPRGIAISPDGRWAYVALTAANEVAVLDLDSASVMKRIPVGRWPRYLALTPDGSRLAVGCSGDGGVWVIDTATREPLYDTRFMGLNLGHMQVSADGQYVYFPWMVYADRPISKFNIREGWVLGNRLARVRMDGKTRREAMALDPRGHGVADPHGLALSPDGNWLAMTASGTHELVLVRLEGLPFSSDGTGDHIRSDVVGASDRFIRVPLSGRPMALRFDSSGRRLFVANYLDNSVQVVDVASRTLQSAIPLGKPVEPDLARRGDVIFHDALLSTDGWYSCHSCHYDGGGNSLTMDTTNDGSDGTFKMVLSLRNVNQTGPWFWHGVQTELGAALRKSLVDTMEGPDPTDEDVRALIAFFDNLPAAPNSRRAPDGGLSPSAERGRLVFESEAASCSRCHAGPYFTDGAIHDVGLGSKYDVYQGFNTPSLIGGGNRVSYLHHGRAKSLAQLLTELHSPAKVSGTRELTAEELNDLIEYLRSL